MSSIPLEGLTRSELHVLDTVTQMDVASYDPPRSQQTDSAVVQTLWSVSHSSGIGVLQ